MDSYDVKIRPGDDHVHPQPDQLGGEFRQALHVAVSIAAFEDQVAALDIAQIAQPIAERVE